MKSKHPEVRTQRPSEHVREYLAWRGAAAPAAPRDGQPRSGVLGRALGAPWLLSLLLLGLGGLGGCSKSSASPPLPGACSKADECGEGERCDLGARRCVPACKADNECPKDSGTRCDEATGVCIAAETCQQDYNCGASGEGYCADLDCVCVPDAKIAEEKAPSTGVCWRPAQSCEPCASDLECGGGGGGLGNQAACKRFLLGGEEASVCLPSHGRGCPQGMIAADASASPELAGYCIPQAGDCGEATPCVADSDCKNSASPICDLVQQICIPGCTFDVAFGRSIGCAPGRICHANAKGSDPSLLEKCETADQYGVGSCKQPCLGDDECREIDPSFVCKDDGAGARCRPEGCIDDFECRSTRKGYDGFCDVATGSCIFDSCRLGPDPRKSCDQSEPFSDCQMNFECTGDVEDGFGFCRELNCIEVGGTHAACARGNFCAGQVFLDPITKEPIERTVPIPAGVEAGSCYPMEHKTFCGSRCDVGNDCIGLPGITDYPESPHLCDNFGLKDDICFWGCEFEEECPASWNCSSRDFVMECGGPGLQTCERDEECATGSKCVEPLVGGFPLVPEHGAFKVCECTDSEACGAGFTCNAGIATANWDPSSSEFNIVKARYCADSRGCGRDGSCEWFGEMVEPGLLEPARPIFHCGATPYGMEGEKVSCPDQDPNGVPVRAGKLISDQRHCVYTSICQPGFTPPRPWELEKGPTCESL